MPSPSAIQGDGSVQQGLSAAYESIAFCKHRRAADKRYSLDLRETPVNEKRWETYEEVAAYLLNRLAEHFGVGHFEGKQVVPGESGTEWELDARGVGEGGARIIVVECKRLTKSGISQAITGALAFTIQDVGAHGGILVSPLGLQEGAKKVAAHANIVEATLTPNSTTTDYVLRFLNQIHVGISESIHLTDECSVELRDKDGNVIDHRKV